VIAVVRSDEEASRARTNGADEVIESNSSDVISAVQKLTGERGANAVFDTTGFMFPIALEIAAIDGRVPVISAPPDGKATFNLRDLYHRTLRVIGVDTRQMDATACARLLEMMGPHFESGKFKSAPAVSRPLNEAIDAYRDAAAGKQRFVLLPNA
jgi:NADPH:quinone reductase-like Zn-dependent oxidoreductase